MIAKIAIIGPESTGKSFLCNKLALHFNTLWCPEYSREYLKEIKKNYTYDDLGKIAKGQIQWEDQYILKAANAFKQEERNSTLHPLFIDTELFVLKIWSEFVFGKCHRYIVNEIQTRKYDLYLLCNTDLPWLIDDLREYPDEKIRNSHFEAFVQLLNNQPAPWHLISGSETERILLAIEKVTSFLKQKKGAE